MFAHAVHNLPSVTRQLDDRKIARWSDRVGGFNQATMLIMQTLKCSPSKAEKIAAGRYQSKMPPLEMEALVELTKCTLDELFPQIRNARLG